MLPAALCAALRTVLDDAAELARGLDGDAALVDVVAARLLDVNVLAGLARPDGHQRVPVVRRRDRDDVHVLVFEDLADILDRLRLLSAGLLDLLDAARVGARVGIDESDDLDAFHAGEL